MKRHAHEIEGRCCRNRGRVFAIGVLVAVVANLPAGGALAEPTGGPSPTLSVPPVGQHGFPFMSIAAHVDLAELGFIEDEVFMEGTARSYVPDAPLAGITDGRWDSSPTGPTASYKTRLLIRRPVDPARFNGTVIVEWNNASSAFDLDAIFVPAIEEITREGYAYVGVTAQARGVNFMKTWETGEGARYAALEHAGESYSYDIFGQAAQAIRDPDPTGPAPLGDLTGGIRELIVVGNSQSGSRLITYINAVHPTIGSYDGFMPFFATTGAPLSQPPLALVAAPTGAASRIRTDSDEPVLFINSETEFAGGARGIHSQPDSQHFRLWELTGYSHAPGLIHLDPIRVGQLFASLGLVVSPRDCGPLPVNDTDQYPPFKAGLHAIRKWVQTGRAPIPAPRVDVVIPSDPTQPATVARDPVTGIAIGGLRLPDVDVPIRTLSGERAPAAVPPTPACGSSLFGASDAWNGDSDPYDGTSLDISGTPEPSLSVLYKRESRYVAAVTISVIRNVLLGYLRPHDAIDIIEKARTVDIP